MSRIVRRTGGAQAASGRGRHGPLLRSASEAGPPIALAVSALAVAFGCLSLSLNSLDPYRLLMLGGLAVALSFLALSVWSKSGYWSVEVLALVSATLAGGAVLALLPEYLYGREVNGVIHRSLIGAGILLVVGLPSLSAALYHALGATPSARDVSRYPYVLFPVSLALLLYGAIIVRLVEKGVPDLTWSAITQAYSTQLTSTALVSEAGMRNHILGTLLLVAMTAVLAVPVGVGAGMFISEYGGWWGRAVAFATSMLRAISVFVLAVSAFGLVRSVSGYETGTPISDLVRGYYYDAAGFKHAASGSFLTASLFLSLLVIPIVARATEEGFRSLPLEIREGSHALGATEGHALLRILLPWALPNIVTGLLLGMAEAAGSVTVLLFIAGGGENGVGPLREVTSLAFLVFDSGNGSKAFQDAMGPYQYSAALLLLGLTTGFTAAALVLRQRFANRYRAGISYG